MYKLLTLVIYLSLTGCNNPINSNIYELEFSLIKMLDSANQETAYKSCILLGELALTDQLITLIKKSNAKLICKAYLLSKRIISTDSKINFISHFPQEIEQKEIWQFHSTTGYPLNLTPPYFDYLSYLSNTSDDALDTLVKSLSYTDGAHAEVLVEALARHYKVNNERVINALNTNNIDSKSIDLIHKTSNFL